MKDRKLVHYRGDYTAFKKMHLQKRATLDKEYKKQQECRKCFAETEVATFCSVFARNELALRQRCSNI